MNEILREMMRVNRGAPKIPEYDPQARVGPNEPGPGSPNWITANPGKIPPPKPWSFRARLVVKDGISAAEEKVVALFSPLERANTEIEETEIGQNALSRFVSKQGKGRK